MNYSTSEFLIGRQLRVKGLAAFSLIEVCVATVILAIIGSQMHQLSRLTSENFRATKDYLDADRKIYSEIAFARTAAQQYTWCNVLNGIDMDPETFARKAVANSSYSKISDFCADSFYSSAPASVYRPPYILTQTDPALSGVDRKCYGFMQGSSDLLPIGTLKIEAGKQDRCERSTAYVDTSLYSEYKPWELFRAKCKEDMHNNSYEPTRTVTQFPEKKSDGSNQADRTPAEKDPIVGNLVNQLEKHARYNNVISHYYNKSSVDLKMSHRILLFYTVNLYVKGATRSITRVLYLTAPVAAWCPY